VVLANQVKIFVPSRWTWCKQDMSSLTKVITSDDIFTTSLPSESGSIFRKRKNRSQCNSSGTSIWLSKIFGHFKIGWKDYHP